MSPVIRDDRSSLPLDDGLDALRTEIAILKKLNHPNIVRLFEVLESSEQDMLYMGIELFQY
jgi:[calcium/calmodulin-dependent protein kinase] kinase